MPATFSASGTNLNAKARAARDRLVQRFLYEFGRAIPDLKFDDGAVDDIEELVDSLIEATTLACVAELHRNGPAL